MKYTILKITMLLGMTGFFGCTDFLDTTPTDRISDKLVWRNEATVDLYINPFYAYIDRYGSFGAAQFSGSLTEGLTETFKYGSYPSGSKAGDANNYVFRPESITPTGYLLNAWKDGYERIRRVNEFIVNLHKYSVLTVEKNQFYEAQARFFRAFLYFQLAKRHGGVILYTDMNLVLDKPRSTAEETWNLIAEDLDYAAKFLPKEWDGGNSGRVTRGAAFAIKSRAMLYAERWQEAKNAADSVFALNKYALADRYADAWKGNNSESILEYNYRETGPNHTFDFDYVPFGEVTNGGGKGTPTQEMVEEYEKQDGTKVDWSAWKVSGGTTARPPYEQLEPRFQATIIYNGCTWKNKVMTNSVGGTNGKYMTYREEPYSSGRTVTGYYLRKLLDETHTQMNLQGAQTWVEIRLAEVYLNRAEANFRLTKTGNALNDLNAVRTRPGVNLPRVEGLTGDALFAAIRHERKVELSYEGHLYWDMRRWKLAHVEYNDYRCHGMKISPDAAGYNYEYVDCDLQDRKFLKKTYVLPVPSSELSNNSAIEQYDEWK